MKRTENKIILLVVIALTLMFSLPAVANANSGPPGCTNPTVVDGFVKYANGSAVGAGFNVSVSVSGPSSCASFSDLTDSNGYYAIPGLDIDGNSVSASTSVGIYTSSNSSTASGSTLRLNLIPTPDAPTLTAVSDSHNGTNIIMSWTTGSIPDNAVVHDEWELVSVSSNSSATSPEIVNVTSFATYTWRVRTCYTSYTTICSSYSSDSFNVANTAPSNPVQTDQTNTHESFVNLTWTSGTDSDTLPTDSLVDEFYFDDDPSPMSAPLISNFSITTGTHTFNVTGLTVGTTYYWLVRTCDDTFASNNCSSSTDSFTVANTAPSSPTLTEIEKTDNATQSLYWTSGTDGEGDSVYDDFQLANNSGFSSSSLVVNSTSVSSPVSVSLPDFDIFWWRARTCDTFGLCSSWSSSIFQKYTCSGSTLSCPAAPGGGGGGGAGGGAAPSFAPSGISGGKEFSFQTTGIDAQVSKDSLSTTLSPGQQVSRRVQIKNTGVSTSTYQLYVSNLPEGFIQLSTTEFTLKPGETKFIDISVSPDATTLLDTYVAQVVAVTGSVEKSVSVVVDVESPNPLFAVDMILPDKYQSISLFTPSAEFTLPVTKLKLVPQIQLFDVGKVGVSDVLVMYKILDSTGKTIFTDSQVVSVDGQERFTKSISLPRSLASGEYVLVAQADYGDRVSISSQRFEIKRGGILDFLMRYWMWLILIGIVGVVIYHHLAEHRKWYIVWKKKRSEKKKNKHKRKKQKHL